MYLPLRLFWNEVEPPPLGPDWRDTPAAYR